MGDTSLHGVSAGYWTAFLQGCKPCSFPGPPRSTTTSLQDSFAETIIDLEGTHVAIQEFCTRHQVSDDSIFQTAWAIVISGYAGVEDVSFGYFSAMSCMDEKHRSAVISRAQITPNTLLRQQLVDMTKNLDNALAHRDCSMTDVQKLLGCEGQPFFNLALQVQRGTSAFDEFEPHRDLIEVRNTSFPGVFFILTL